MTSKHGGSHNSDMDSESLPNQKLFTFSASNMLTPSEEDLLRQHLKETVDLARQILDERKQRAA